MVVFPAVIQQSCEEKLYIHFSSLTEAIHLAVTLETKSQNHTLVEQDVEKPGTFQSITFQVSVDVATALQWMLSHRSTALLWAHCPFPSRLSIFPYQCEAKYNSVLQSKMVGSISCVEKNRFF